MRFGLVLCALAVTLAAGCRATPEAPAPATVSDGQRSASLMAMEHVARGAQRCWFAGRDATFADYRMANELNSFSDRPRILIVPANNPESRPLLVVQAEGASPQVEAFGPLMDRAGEQIDRDVRRWAQGSTACA